VIEPLDLALEKARALISFPELVNRIVFSGRQRNKSTEYLRIAIRPINLKNGLHWQVVSHDGKKDFTKNLTPNQFHLEGYLNSGYSNLTIETQTQEMSIRVTKSGESQTILRQKDPNLAKGIELEHDRVKRRLLDKSEPLFQLLGITDHLGNLKPTKTDKFKQVQEFLKSIDAASDYLVNSHNKLANSQEINLVDLGCGHAYLTFAAHQFLKQSGKSIRVLGVDERIDSRDRNNQIAAELKISDEIYFQANSISNLEAQKVDIAIALHACDTATDDAIAWAVKNDAQVILVAPCCQHDIQKQIKDAPAPWHIATRYGILHERVGDIITDSIRAQILRVLGYRTEIIEFIAGDHTPRNLMIRAFKVDSKNNHDGTFSPKISQEFEDLQKMVSEWKIKPKLMDLLGNQLNK
jgi:SAM-dependent methyltransferase